MRLDHLLIIHLVQMVARQDKNKLSTMIMDRVNVLIDRIRCPFIPVLSEALLRGNGVNELAQLRRNNVPPGKNMLLQRK